MNDNRYAPPGAPVTLEGPVMPPRARAVQWGAWTLWAQFAIGLPGTVYRFFNPLVELTSEVARIVFTVSMLTTLVVGLLFSLFVWLAWRGGNRARIVVLIAGTVGLVFAIPLMRDTLAIYPYNGVILILQSAMNVVGVAMLFAPGANAWYRAMKAARRQRIA